MVNFPVAAGVLSASAACIAAAAGVCAAGFRFCKASGGTALYLLLRLTAAVLAAADASAPVGSGAVAAATGGAADDMDTLGVRVAFGFAAMAAAGDLPGFALAAATSDADVVSAAALGVLLATFAAAPAARRATAVAPLGVALMAA